VLMGVPLMSWICPALLPLKVNTINCSKENLKCFKVCCLTLSLHSFHTIHNKCFKLFLVVTSNRIP
jgi:hypothetical protein